MSTHRNDLVREEIEHSETIRDYPLEEASPTRPGRQAARVYSVRLAPETVAELDHLADDLDVPTSALIRGFIAQGLAAHRETNVATLLDKLETDVRHLRGIVGLTA